MNLAGEEGRKLPRAYSCCGSPGGLPDTWLCSQPQLLSMVHVHRLTPTPALMFTTAVALVLVIPGNFSTIVNFLRQVRLSSRVGISWCLCVHAHIHSFTYLTVLCVCTLMHVYVYIHNKLLEAPMCNYHIHACVYTYICARTLLEA